MKKISGGNNVYATLNAIILKSIYTLFTATFQRISIRKITSLLFTL